ncbi:MAG: hypothetical protein IJZ59_01395 [Alphaproteobacteria bacterium]|nr:hypothetical protein [Alphaproteobacteria bacterium]
MSDTNAGKELIEATQEAVIDAVNDVGNIIMTTTEEISGGHHEIFYKSAEFWVGMAFVVVVIGLFSPIKKALNSLIKGKIDSVIKRIDDAASLRDEARKLLADYEQKVEDMDFKTNSIIKEAENKAKEFTKNELQKFEKELATQEKDTESLIEVRKEQIISETTGLVAGRTMNILKRALSNKLNDKIKSELVDESIKSLEQLRKS